MEAENFYLYKFSSNTTLFVNKTTCTNITWVKVSQKVGVYVLFAGMKGSASRCKLFIYVHLFLGTFTLKKEILKLKIQSTHLNRFIEAIRKV